jgi:ketosteroid isomerase-like protein
MAERAAVMAGGRIEIDLLCEDADRVLALVTVTATGRSSGATAAARTAHLYEFDGDTVARVTYYDREDGIDAMGRAGARLRCWLRGNAAFGSRDADAFLSCFTEDAEVTTLFGGAGPRLLRDEQEIRTYLGDLKDTWTRLELEVEHIRFAGDLSLARSLASGRGRESDVEVRQPVWLVTAWRGDLAVRHASYLEYAAARDAFLAGTA